MAMKSRKELLLQELEDISAQLVDIQYRLDASKRKPVPTIPVIYPEERHQDPFHVSKSGTVPDLEFKVWFLREIIKDLLLSTQCGKVLQKAITIFTGKLTLFPSKQFLVFFPDSCLTVCKITIKHNHYFPVKSTFLLKSWFHDFFW